MILALRLPEERSPRVVPPVATQLPRGVGPIGTSDGRDKNLNAWPDLGSEATRGANYETLCSASGGITLSDPRLEMEVLREKNNCNSGVVGDAAAGKDLFCAAILHH